MWRGLISPIAFIVSLFDADVAIHEIHNNGNWYDFGFMLGVSGVSSGGVGVGGGAASGRAGGADLFATGRCPRRTG